jgi:hemolysin III
MNIMAKRAQTLNEEIANAITHGLGVLFCLVAIPLMVIYALQTSNAAMVWAVAIFGFGMLMVYSASTLYHYARHIETKRILRIWDHISIFLLIAGSYTPLVIKYTDFKTSVIFLSIMWSVVAVGSFLKIFYTGKYNILSVIIYLAMGLMAVFIIKPIIANMPQPVFYLLLAGGVAYVLGIVFYLWHKLQYHHTIWHVFVLTGTVTHFFAVYNSIPINIKL